MQKYKFTCLHEELKSTTLQCDPIRTRPCFAWSRFLCCHMYTPNLSRRGAVQLLVVMTPRGLPQVWSSAGYSSPWGRCHTEAAGKVSSSLPTHLRGFKLLKRQAILASEACYSTGREGGSWHIKIIHEHNIRESIHHCPKVLPSCFCVGLGENVACPSSDPVCGQKGKSLSTGASDCHCWRNKAMLHLSTHSQRSSWHAQRQNQRVTWSDIESTDFLEYGNECLNARGK